MPSEKGATLQTFSLLIYPSVKSNELTMWTNTHQSQLRTWANTSVMLHGITLGILGLLRWLWVITFGPTPKVDGFPWVFLGFLIKTKQNIWVFHGSVQSWWFPPSWWLIPRVFPANWLLLGVAARLPPRPGNQVPEISVHTFQGAFLEPGGTPSHVAAGRAV